MLQQYYWYRLAVNILSRRLVSRYSILIGSPAELSGAGGIICYLLFLCTVRSQVYAPSLLVN